MRWLTGEVYALVNGRSICVANGRNVCFGNGRNICVGGYSKEETAELQIVLSGGLRLTGALNGRLDRTG